MITMKFYKGVRGDKMKNWLNFTGDQGLLIRVNEQKIHHNSLVVGLVCTARGAGNPEALGLAFHQGSTFINAYCAAAPNLFDRD